MSILVIAAHPDDEILGCGGTMARLRNEGHDVAIAILGEGITSRYATREKADAQLLKELQDCGRKASSLLNIENICFYDLPDNRFDTIPLLEIVKKIEALIERLKPTTIYTHHGGDLNVDHTLVFKSVLTATRPMQNSCVKEIFAFEIPSSTDWAFQQLTPFHPNTFVDISKTIDIKLSAMQAYCGEIRPFPHPRSLEALQANAKRWGSVAGVQYAEAFELIRSIR